MKKLCVCGDPVQFVAGPYRVGFCSVQCIPIAWRPVRLRATKYRDNAGRLWAASAPAK